MVALQPVSLRASATVSKTGMESSNFSPPRPGGDAGDDVGAIVAAAARVERAGFAGDALHEQAGVFIDEDGHSGRKDEG